MQLAGFICDLLSIENSPIAASSFLFYFILFFLFLQDRILL